MSMVAALGFGIAFAVAQVAGFTPLAYDAGAYWAAEPGRLYEFGWYFTGHEHAAFLYSPAFADALIPFRIMPERVFTGLWQLGLFAVLIGTIRGFALPVLLAGVVSIAWPIPIAGQIMSDIAMGNIHILLGAVAVFGLRWPALWSFALLSKATPGVGLVWFVARREWRNLAIALAVTGVIALASFVFQPQDWFAWIGLLGAPAPDFPLWVVPLPLWVRVPLSAALIWWGARTDRAWTVPIAVGFAIPMPYGTMVATMICALAYARLDSPPQSFRTRPPL